MHIISLDHENTFTTLSLQASHAVVLGSPPLIYLLAGPDRPTFIDLSGRNVRHNNRQEQADHVPQYRPSDRCTSANRGRYCQRRIDRYPNQASIPRSVNRNTTDHFAYRFLGSQPAKLIRTNVHGAPAILALSSRSWLNYTYQDRLEFAPLIYDSLEYASSFSAEMCPDGLIGVTGNTLR